MKIDFIMDPICPWCYIGRSRLRRAITEWGDDDIMVNIIPFQLNPDMPRDGMDRQTYMHLKFGSSRSAQAVMDGIARAAETENLDIRQEAIGRTPNTRNAHRLIARAAKSGRMDQMVDSMFKAYLIDGQDIGADHSLLDIAEACGFDRDETHQFLSGSDGIEEIQATEEMARQMGVRGVPFFIIDGKFAITGAEDISVFRQVFDLARNQGGDLDGRSGLGLESPMSASL